MTFVATMENRKLEGGEIWSIHKHNIREELNVSTSELKLLRKTSIDATQSHHNRYFKTMRWDELKALKAKPHKKNTAGAFEIVFSMQNENAQLNENFDVREHKGIIEGFLKEFGITERFDVLEFAYHGDEGINSTHHHYHITFSGWDRLEEKFNINGFFSPVIAEEFQYDKQGHQLFKKIDKGRERGIYMRQNNGRRIPKTKPVRAEGMQLFQDAWESYLLKNTPYWNKKPFTSMVQIPKSVYKAMNLEERERLSEFRELENIKYEHLFNEEYHDKGLLTLINEKMIALLLSLNDVIEGATVTNAIDKHKQLERTKLKIKTQSPKL